MPSEHQCLQSHPVGLPYSRVPLGRLPTEILTGILILVLEYDQKATAKSLSRVCSVWHNTIRESGAIFSIIKYPITDADFDLACSTAGYHPLRIFYESSGVYNQCKQLFIERCSTLVSRWYIVSWIGMRSEEVCGLPKLPAPSLRLVRSRALGLVFGYRTTSSDALHLRFGIYISPRSHYPRAFTFSRT